MNNASSSYAGVAIRTSLGAAETTVAPVVESSVATALLVAFSAASRFFVASAGFSASASLSAFSSAPASLGLVLNGTCDLDSSSESSDVESSVESLAAYKAMFESSSCSESADEDSFGCERAVWFGCDVELEAF